MEISVALITDLPAWVDKRGYLDMLAEIGPKYGIRYSLHLLEGRAQSRTESVFGYERALKAVRAMSEIDSDVLHVQFTFPLGLAFSALKRMFSRLPPVLIHTHGYDVFTVPEVNYGLRRTKIGEMLAKLGWRWCNHIVAVSAASRAEISRYVPTKKISIVHNSVDSSVFRKQPVSSRDLMELTSDAEFVLVNVANLVPVKNHIRMLQAFRMFLDQSNMSRKCKFLVVGDGAQRTILQHYAVELKVEENVAFLGSVPRAQLPDIYNSANLFILPSLSEAHPWSLLEAMSCELPALASAVGGIPETISDFNLLFDPRNPNDICRVLLNATRNRDDLRETGIANRHEILSRFTIETHIKALRAAYEDTLEIA